MKKKLIIIVFCFFSTFSFANDWEFWAEGEHIVPLRGSNVAIEKEKLTFKLVKEGLLVNVKFIFNSPVDEKKLIGFITPGAEKENYPLGIKDFKTIVNGKEVKSNVKKFSEVTSKKIIDKKVIKEYEMKKAKYDEYYYDRDYVYYFEADFKKGINIVEHSYLFSPNNLISNYKREFTYILTTISKWKNKKIKDFEIEVYPGTAFVRLPYTFWENKKKIDWKIIGSGKIASIEPMTKAIGDYFDSSATKLGGTFVKLDSGYLSYKAKDFCPDDNYEFFLNSVDEVAAFPQLFENVNLGKYIILEDKYMYPLYLASIGKINEDFEFSDDFTKNDFDILYNFPYALAGYDFDRKDLKDYFSKFFWYSPVSKNVKINPHYTKLLKIIDKERAKRKI